MCSLCISFEDTALKAESIDLHIIDNRIEHHTDEYEHEDLIVRRCQPFTLTINFNRAYNDREDTVVLQFVTGEIRFMFSDLPNFEM